MQKPPSGPDWLHEAKFDGYRAISVIDHDKVQIFTRRGLDWSARMPGIAEALASLKVRSAVIDGEAIVAGIARPTSSLFPVYSDPHSLARNGKGGSNAQKLRFSWSHRSAWRLVPIRCSRRNGAAARSLRSQA
jgi:hypothetical protein